MPKTRLPWGWRRTVQSCWESVIATRTRYRGWQSRWVNAVLRCGRCCYGIGFATAPAPRNDNRLESEQSPSRLRLLLGGLSGFLLSRERRFARQEIPGDLNGYLETAYSGVAPWRSCCLRNVPSVTRLPRFPRNDKHYLEKGLVRTGRTLMPAGCVRAEWVGG